eukprot:COSAG01_NODE_46268_length_401_cov_1.956954_1_plen_27_part_01
MGRQPIADAYAHAVAQVWETISLLPSG